MTTARQTVYCLLGSNLGDRLGLLRHATFALAATGQVELVSASRAYRTPPWGGVRQPDYLNAALKLKTSLSPESLLERFKEIETNLGRSPGGERWAARLIDLDLGLYGGAVLCSESLTVPHKHLAERAFALIPLLELAPELRDPADGEPYAGKLARLGAWTWDGDGEKCFALNDGGHIYPAGPLTLLSGDSWEPDASALLCRSAAPLETEKLAETLARHLRGGETIALSGNLGAGKTCFARGLARGLDIPGPVTSPSYVLVKSYEGRLTLHHADFYRLAGDDPAVAPEPPDLASLGLEDYMEDPGAVLLIEWAERYPSFLEPPFWLVEIEGAGEEPRFLLARKIKKGE